MISRIIAESLKVKLLIFYILHYIGCVAICIHDEIRESDKLKSRFLNYS